MSYLEKKQGLPAEDYSPTFLELDAESGPWFTRSQQDSPIRGDKYPDYKVDMERGVITFAAGERVGAVAAFAVLGTYRTEDKQWLWAWANPDLETHAKASMKVREEQPDIPEFEASHFVCSETKAWSVAAAAAFQLKAQGCYRLPGEVQTYVALLEIQVMDPDGMPADPAKGDPEAAAKTLAEYAGPMALNLGGLLLDALRSERISMDEVVGALHGFCDNLEHLVSSPMGQGTPAAAEAHQVSSLLRQGVLLLSVPPGEALQEGAREVLSALRDLAQRYGAWNPEEQAKEAPAPNDGGGE